ncbi:MAG TPA: hypothetical protein VGD58_09030, partial [Herpetosiphonaceae bacterium]
QTNGQMPPDRVLQLLDIGHIDEQLHTLNLCQQRYDVALREIESLRQHLFADWYRYLLCLYPPQGSGEDYPDPDEVMAFIEREVLAPLEQKLALAGLPPRDLPVSLLDPALVVPSGVVTLADALGKAFDDVRGSLERLNASPAAQAARVRFKPQAIAAPRFWQPNDPVVLLAGPTIRPSPRHGQDGRLHPDGLLVCQMVGAIDVARMSPGDLPAILTLIDALENPAADEQIGFQVWRGPAWHPLELEWEVDVLPTANLGNIDASHGQYDETFVTANYTLADNQPDLTPQDREIVWRGATNLYSGASVLTPYARDYQSERLASFIYLVYARKQALPPLADRDAVRQLQTKAGMEQIEQWLQDWAAAIDKDRQMDDAAKQTAAEELRMVALALRAFEHLRGIQCLSQALGGFNEALLMQRQTLQLPIGDPLGFADYQPFVKRVQAGVGTSNHRAPQPLNDFNPIRSGALRLRALRLVDSFGQVMDLKLDSVVYAQAPADGRAANQVPLPPRVVQPARLNFRWLSAHHDQQEMDVHPGTNPICGWVVANNLDQRLDIYDQDGRPLGAIGPQIWQPLPGTPLIDVRRIGDATLQKLVTQLLRYDEPALMRLLDTLDTALFNIEPASYAQHTQIAVLMSRPLALVRATINLELRNSPAAHQGWNQFRQDLRRDRRDHDAFTRVQIPIRIGDYRQINDGLVGYWLEQDGALGATFYAPNADTAGESIATHAEGELVISQSLDAPPQELTMLIDPRGKIHATCGVVPVKAIDIPPAQYVDALQRIAVTFRAGPILSPPDLLALALPTEPGYDWSWLETRGDGYREVLPEPQIEQAALAADLAAQIWERLLARDIAWLVPDPDHAGGVRVSAAGQRIAQEPAAFIALRGEIETALAQAQQPDATITRTRFVELVAAAFGSPLWAYLIDPSVRWLEGTAGAPARVVVASQRAAVKLADRFAGLDQAIQAALDRRQYRIAADTGDALITGGLSAREGWLVLRVFDAQEDAQ